MSVANSSIAQLYIAYFNRAPEPLGFDFWCDVLDNPVTLEDIASDFATQPEAVAMYPLLEARTTDSLGDFLTTVYQNLFDRDPDAAGLEFWTGVIQGGADFGTILLEIINGASDEDRAVLEAKASVAEYWVGEARMVQGYQLTDDAITASRAAIEAAGTDVEDSTAIVDTYFAPAAQVALTTVPNDVRAIAYAELSSLKDGAAKLLGGGVKLDPYSRAHLEEMRRTIEKVEEASLTLARP